MQSLNFIPFFEIHFEKALLNLSDHDSFQPAQKEPEFLGGRRNIKEACAHEGRKGRVESSIKPTKKTLMTPARQARQLL